jgi:hypothetical protein
VRLERAKLARDRHSIGAAHFGLGLYWRWTGEPGQALDQFRLVLEPLRALQVIPTIAATLLHIARLLASAEPMLAARIAGAGLRLAERAGVYLPPRQVRGIDQLRFELGQRLGHEQASHAWTEGESLTTNEMVALAAEAVPSVSATS